jgi:peptidoglycan/xylan/chitin deacetylase (PgdA/CDA1 family)
MKRLAVALCAVLILFATASYGHSGGSGGMPAFAPALASEPAFTLDMPETAAPFPALQPSDPPEEKNLYIIPLAVYPEFETPMPLPTAAPPTPVPTERPKTAYLTFDDGPIKAKKPGKGTAALLDILKAHGVKATFFMLGKCVKAYPDLARRVVDEGHAVGNHTWSHVRPSSVSSARFEKEIRDTNDEIFTVTGVRPTLFRPPYGGFVNAAKMQILSNNGMRSIRWNVDTRDWEGATKIQVLQRIRSGIKNGKDLIILFHDHSFRALDEAIKLLQDSGYVLDTLDHMN